MELPAHPKRVREVEATVNNGGAYNSFISTDGDFGLTGGETITISHNGGGVTVGDFEVGDSSIGAEQEVSRNNDVATTAKYLQLKFEYEGQNEVILRNITIRYQTYPRTC